MCGAAWFLRWLSCFLSGAEADWQRGVGCRSIGSGCGRARFLSASPAFILSALPASAINSWSGRRGSPLHLHQQVMSACFETTPWGGRRLPLSWSFLSCIQVLWEHVRQCRVPQPLLPIKPDAGRAAGRSDRHCKGIILNHFDSPQWWMTPHLVSLAIWEVIQWSVLI